MIQQLFNMAILTAVTYYLLVLFENKINDDDDLL